MALPSTLPRESRLLPSQESYYFRELSLISLRARASSLRIEANTI